MTDQLFILGDADQIRRKIEALLLSGQLEDLHNFSRDLAKGVEQFARLAQVRLNAEVVFSGGDDILLIVEAKSYSDTQLHELMEEFENLTGATISLGVGRSAEQAYLNLARAKAAGPGTLKSVLQTLA